MTPRGLVLPPMSLSKKPTTTCMSVRLTTFQPSEFPPPPLPQITLMSTHFYSEDGVSSSETKGFKMIYEKCVLMGVI
jgi:hypothetical protein